MRITDEDVKKHEDLVKKIVTIYKYSHPNFDFDILMCYGYEGLIDAFEKYDENREVSFDTYASQRIRGAILDGVRIELGSKRVNPEIYNGVKALYEKNFSNEEIAEKLNIKESTVEHMISLYNYYNMQYLDDPNFNVELSNSNSSMLEVENFELPGIINEVLETLTDKQRRVIELIYFEELSESETARRLNVHQPDISRTHKAAISKMRRLSYRLEDYI